MTVPVKIVGLIDARNGLRDALVRLRGGHGATQDDGDLALAALDIAIGRVYLQKRDPTVSVSALRALLEQWEQDGDSMQAFLDLAALCDAAETKS
jgi:hypothetical protein